jgi:hypothetical protein
LRGSRFQRAVTERNLQNASDRDDIIGDIIYFKQYEQYGSARRAHRAHVGSIVAWFDD